MTTCCCTSRARTKDEDVNVDPLLVDVDPSIGLEFVSLAKKIETILGVPTEIVSRRAIKPRAFQFIERDLMYV